jgi:transposase-like protein
MIRDGIAGAEVARRLGVGSTTIGRWRKSAGLSGKSNSDHNLLKEEGLQMIRDGIAGAEVARRLGASKTTVTKWRKSAGLSGRFGSVGQFHDIEKENDVIDLLREGRTFKQITDSTGVGRDKIRRIKREAEREGFL